MVFGKANELWQDLRASFPYTYNSLLAFLSKKELQYLMFEEMFTNVLAQRNTVVNHFLLDPQTTRFVHTYKVSFEVLLSLSLMQIFRKFTHELKSNNPNILLLTTLQTLCKVNNLLSLLYL